MGFSQHFQTNPVSFFVFCEEPAFPSSKWLQHEFQILDKHETDAANVVTPYSPTFSPHRCHRVNTNRNHFTKHINLLCMWYKLIQSLLESWNILEHMSSTSVERLKEKNRVNSGPKTPFKDLRILAMPCYACAETFEVKRTSWGGESKVFADISDTSQIS